MKKIFTAVEVIREKKMNIGTFYLASEANIWWSIVKDPLQGCKLTCAKLFEELRAKLYPMTVQQHKEKKFMGLEHER